MNGSRSARATSAQKVAGTASGVAPSPYVSERSAAHRIHCSKAGSAPVQHAWIIPRQARPGSTPLSRTNRSVRSGNIWEYTVPRYVPYE